VFQNPASGWYPFDPSRTLDPETGPVWDKLVNFRWQDGYLEKRRSPVDLDGAGGGATPNQPPIGYPQDDRFEYPLYLFQIESDNTTTPDNSYETISVLVTHTDIYVFDPVSGGWLVATPQFTLGTIGWSSGSPNVSGSGTNWLLNNVAVGSQIELETGEWHTVLTVTGEGAMTVSPNPTTTKAAQPYVLRRCFATDSSILNRELRVDAVVFNGDLYVAASDLGGPGVPAVCRCAVAINPPTVAEYLTASVDLTASGTPLDTIPNVTEINGLDILEDGRVIIAVSELADTIGVNAKKDGTYFANARLRYSDLTDQKSWNTSPAGFVDVTSGGIGQIQAFARFGRDYAIHYRDGIALASPTGAANPPLAIRRTKSHVGSSHYRTIRNLNGVQFFVGVDDVIYQFDGSKSIPVNNSFRDRLRTHQKDETSWRMFAAGDTYYNEYQVYWVNPAAGLARPTECFSLDLNTGDPRWEMFPLEIYFVSDYWVGQPASTGASSREDGTQIAARLYDPNTAPPPPQGQKQILFRFKERFSTDVLSNASVTEGIEARTEAWDMGYPGFIKSIDRVILKMRQVPDNLHTLNADAITVSVSWDGGVTWASISKTFTYPADGQEVTKHFIFDEYSGEAVVIRIKSDVDDELAGQIVRILVRGRVFGEEEFVEETI
jgi:hypothetical protein